MSRQPRMNVKQELKTQTDTLVVAKPFVLEQDDRRRYVRLEISTPMELKKIKDIGGGFWPLGNHPTISGLILNISASGLLIEVSEPVNEGDIVAMRFTLQEVEQLDHVLGLVKRSESDDEGYLVGIEFVTRADLADVFTELEMNELPEQLTDFDETVRTVLNKYIRTGRSNGDTAA